MKQKRTYVTLLLIVALLCLGIAYASISDTTLTITGNVVASPNANNFVVKFQDNGTAEVKVGDKDKITVTPTASGTAANLEILGLTASGETVEATWTIVNSSPDLLAELSINTSAISDNVDATDYFEITTTVNGIKEASPKTTLNANGGNTTVTVTVKLIKTPVENNVNGTIDVKLTAKPVQPVA